MKQLEDYIMIIKDALTSEECDEILEIYPEEDKTWQAAADGSAEYRKCDYVNLSVQEDIRAKSVDEKIYKATAKLLQQYADKWPQLTVEQDTGYTLLKYKEGDYYKQHHDSYYGEQRSLSCTIALNDDYEGGAFKFFDGEHEVQLEKGDALLFPATFQYPHQIEKVTKGTRYSIVTWFV